MIRELLWAKPQLNLTYKALSKVLEDAGWFELIDLTGYYFPPGLKEGPT